MYLIYWKRYQLLKEESLSVVTYMLDWDIIETGFELQSRYNVHFRLILLGKVWTSLFNQLWVK